MDDISGDLQQRLANLVRRGVVHSIKIGKIPRCRVEIAELVTDWLPLCYGFSGGNRTESNYPAVGDPVTILSEAGDLRNGRVYPGGHTGKHPAPAESDSEHVTVYGDGTEIRYDREAHALTITIAENGSYTIKGTGRLDGSVQVTENLQVIGNILGAEVSDKKGSMSQVRTVYNGHNHRGDSGGETGNPNQSM